MPLACAGPSAHTGARPPAGSAETFDTNEQAERKVVPKSGEARTRVRQLLMATSFFSDADKADAQRMTQLIDAFEELRAEAGTNIITQGEQGDSFYLVESGQYEVLILTDARNPFKSWSSSEEYERVCMGTHGPGESFGEVALMYNTARSATVRCVEEGVLWRLDRASFRAIVLASEVSTIARREAFLKSIELFSALTERERSQLVPLLTEEKFADSEYIVSEGDVADCLYLVYDGEVVCHKNEVPAPTTSSAASFLKAREVQMGRAAFTLARRGTEDIIARPVQRGQDLMRLATGDMFGESCLLNTTEGLKSGKEIQERRKANVVAVGNVMMLRLAREDFERVLGTLRDAISSGLKSKILRAVPLLGELPITEREQVIGLFTDVTYKRGQDIVVEGDARKDERRFYIIEEGSVDLYQTPARGTRQEKFASLGRGEFFGERSILTGEPPVATVRAASDVVRCVALAQSDFVKSFGSVEKFLQREMTKRDRTNLQAQKSAVPFHKLELIEVLGTGSFGRVQLVSAPNGRSYALKCMHKAKLVELKQVEHANNERQLMLMCDHPFVLKLHATYQTEDEVFLLIDLVLGGELFSLLGTVRETGGFSEPATRLYAACVVSAIGHMHDREIVYRDLKPENLLLDERGYLRIADLGFAKIVKDRTFTLCGTPDYLAVRAPRTRLDPSHPRARARTAVARRRASGFAARIRPSVRRR